MASTDKQLPFGFRNPSEEDFGALARTIVEEADSNIRIARRKALIFLVPSVFFYIVFSAMMMLVFWSVDIKMSNRLFLTVTACVFLIMALLGRHYQAEMDLRQLTSAFSARHAAFILQAYLVKGITSFFFLYPYHSILNLARLFPRAAKVDSLSLTAAVSIASALDIPVKLGELMSVLPPGYSRESFREAILLLRWSKTVEILIDEGDTVLFPSEDMKKIPPVSKAGTDLIPFSSLLTGETVSLDGDNSGISDLNGKTEPGDDVYGSEPWNPPAWMKPFAEHPFRYGLTALGSLIAFIIVCKIAVGWYRSLPAELQAANPPFLGETFGSAEREGYYYVGRQGSVDRISANTLESYTIEMKHLEKLWGEKPGLDNVSSEFTRYLASFKEIWFAEPDPSGKYFLVYGRYECDDGQGNVSCGSTSYCLIDLYSDSFYPCSLFNYLPIKGWWDEGRLLAVKPSSVWERGGGDRYSSDNLSGDILAVDVRTGDVSTVFTTKEGYFARAGRENGKNIYLAAEIEKEGSYGEYAVTFTEYNDFQPVNSFGITFECAGPAIRQAELTRDGKYWILDMDFSSGYNVMVQGATHALVVINRKGTRWTEATEREDGCFAFLETMTSESNTLVSYIKDSGDGTAYGCRILVTD